MTTKTKTRFKIGETVIITYNSKNYVGVIIDKSITNKMRTFDIRTESGFVIPAVPVDEFTRTTYINSKLSKSFKDKIDTKLNINSSGNIA
jgi:hypothetical protein